MDEPKVSVIIPNYNYADYLSRTVDSVLAQTYGNVEVIVVDDGSRDKSLDVLKKYEKEIAVIVQQNQGVSAARNTGANNSTGDYLAFLDADDIWLPEKLEKQMVKFRDDEEVGLVHCSMTYIDKEEKPTGEHEFGKEGWFADQILLLKGGIVGAGSTAIVRRSLFDEIRGFDKRLSTAADWEFSYRAASRSKVGYVPDSLVQYRIHGSNMHSNLAAMEHDVLIGLGKAFADDAPSAVQRIQSEAYSNFYWMMSGSYFHSKRYGAALKNGVKSVYYKPSRIGNIVLAPLKKNLRRNA